MRLANLIRGKGSVSGSEQAPAPAATGSDPADRPVPGKHGAEDYQMQIWENLVTLNSDKEPAFTLLKPALEYLESDGRKDHWVGLDYADALARDTYPLPETRDREGYYGENHFSYWASGLRDARHLAELARDCGVVLDRYIDLGCASGRVLRHMALENPEIEVLGCDINRLHVEWCNAHLPPKCIVFQNHSIPSLPLADDSVALVSAFSVFTHIEALETAWLMEIRRILRPGGLAWLTVHTEFTLAEMKETWPLWQPTMGHPDAGSLIDRDRNFAGDRLVLRWKADRSYASNVFYKLDYLKERWSRFFEIVEVRRRFPEFQDVLILRKRG